jgi:transcription initiation factor TFIIH subunit 4
VEWAFPWLTKRRLARVSAVHPFLEFLEQWLASGADSAAVFGQVPLALLAFRWVKSGSCVAPCLPFARFLPSLAQFVVQRLLLIRGSVPFSEVRSWFLPESKALQNKLLWRLKQLHILQGRGQDVWLHSSFQESLLKGLSGGLAALEPMSTVNDEVCSLESLDGFARSKWEAILYELVRGNDGSVGPVAKKAKASQVTFLSSLLFNSGLVQGSGNVTSSGFQFLLKDANMQVWTLLLHYLQSIKEAEERLALLGFIAALVLFGVAGRAYPVTGNVPEDRLRELEQLGLVFLQGNKSSARAVPTRLITSLSAAKNSLDFGLAGGSGFLVVETNFRVYAYTSSALQIATLALLLQLRDRFPNMVHGQLTAESIGKALNCGITADQIIDYLQLNAHASLYKSAAQLKDGTGSDSVPFNGVPFTVVDQIRLWELDRKRLRTRPGFMYQQFLSEADYNAALNEAKTLGAVLYAKPGNRVLVVTEESHAHMREFLKKLK